MADKQPMLVFAASYDTIPAALEALNIIEQLHKDKAIAAFDAAVIAKENGKPRIVKRMDRPFVRVIPEELGGGTLPRKELKEVAAELPNYEAGLIAVGDPTIDEAISNALETADKVVKRSVDASADEIAAELKEALNS